MKLIRAILTLIAVTLLLSCVQTIHEYPETTDALVKIDLDVDRDPAALYKVLDITVKDSPQLHSLAEWSTKNTKASQDYPIELLNTFEQTKPIDGWTTRLVWELYEGDNLVNQGFEVSEELVDRPHYHLEMPLKGGNYVLLAWVDYVPSGTEEDYYFNTEDLRKVTTDNTKRAECMNNEERDCFCVAIPINVEIPRTALEVQEFAGTLIRPQGRYVILSDDYKEYIKQVNFPVEQNVSTVRYPSFINTGFNVMTGRPNDSSVRLEYKYIPTLYEFKNNTCVLVAEDYSFVNGSESIIVADLEIKNQRTDYVSNFDNTQIPLYANKLTVIIGNYLTLKSDTGGFSISDEFEDEIVIPIRLHNRHN